MKKVLLALSLGMGLSGAVTVANAFPNGASCADLKQQCQDGNNNSCASYDTYNCQACEGTAGYCGNDGGGTFPRP